MISKKSIIIALCIIAILAGAYLFLSYDKPESVNNADENSTIEKTDVIDPLFEVDKDSIQSIKISNKNGILEFYKQDGQWKLKGAENILYSQNSINTLMFDYVSVKPILLVEENASDISIYGFNDSSPYAEIVTSDGKYAKFILGDSTKGNNGYYFMMDGNDNIYTVSTIIGNNILKSAIDFREKKIIDVSADDVHEINVIVQGTGEVSIRRLSADESNDISSWKMTKPYDIGVYDEKFNEFVLTPITSVQAANFLSDNPTEEQLEESGLKESTLYYEVKTQSETYRVDLGFNFDGYYVAKREDIPTVFLVPQSNLSFLFADVFEYIFSYAYLPKTENIDKINCVIDGKEYSIQCSLDESIFNVNGKSISKDSFVDFYQKFFGIEIQGSTKTPPTDPNDVIFKYTVSNKNGTVDNVSFIHMNGKYSYMKVNDKIQFYVFAEDVQNIQDSVKALAENEEVTKTEIDGNEEKQDEQKGFNWISLLVVILILGLIAAFPISLLKNKNKK